MKYAYAVAFLLVGCGDGSSDSSVRADVSLSVDVGAMDASMGPDTGISADQGARPDASSVQTPIRTLALRASPRGPVPRHAIGFMNVPSTMVYATHRRIRRPLLSGALLSVPVTVQRSTCSVARNLAPKVSASWRQGMESVLRIAAQVAQAAQAVQVA